MFELLASVPADTSGAQSAFNSLVKFLTTSPTALQVLWFMLIAVLWTGYLVLEGFDFGVGMLLPILGKSNKERRAMISSIGPWWDGNEVWLLTAGGATFAAFPEWYATLFSAAYLPLFLILVGLIIRAVAFEYRSKVNSARWHRNWDLCIIIGSWLPSILWGVAFGDLVGGVPAFVDPTQVGGSKIGYAGNFWDLLVNSGTKGYALWFGLTTCLLFLAAGAVFTALKTDGDLRARAEKLAPKLEIAATVATAICAVWLQLAFSKKGWTWIIIAIAAICLLVGCYMSIKKHFGWTFTLNAVAVAGAVALLFGGLYPNVIRASKVVMRGDALTSLGIANGQDITSTVVKAGITGLPIHAASSSPETLKIMTVVACCLVPIVLLYQIWSFWVFHHRIAADRIPDDEDQIKDHTLMGSQSK
ncbi:MAG: cytochrome d ubiquinol oxidase subunit II [Bifidobacteriaceae bacterium]|jgi:cytochrome d ubiquinol oxidase subunit II|nr:cytochrome d ubiquinol oxidase subunit II [Bifidobacteriaceae bacterium]